MKRPKPQPAVLSARYREEDVRDAIQQVVGPNVTVRLTPPCSCCNSTIGYARDHRALWIFPQLWPTTLPLSKENVTPDEIHAAMKHEPQVVGFEKHAELEAFLRKLAGKDHFDVCAPLLRKAFAQGAN